MTEEAQGLALSQFSASLARLVEGVSKSVVEVRSGKRTVASGFVWRPELVVTADEALGDYESATVALDGHTFEAARRWARSQHRCRRPAGERPWRACAAFGGRLVPKTGEIVLAAGRHEGSISARLGIVSMTGAPWLSIRGGQIDSLIRLDIRLGRRSEGGPVIDSEGRAFGMAVRGVRRSVLGDPGGDHRARGRAYPGERLREARLSRPWPASRAHPGRNRNGTDGARRRAGKPRRGGGCAARRRHHGLERRAACGNAGCAAPPRPGFGRANGGTEPLARRTALHGQMRNRNAAMK